MQSLSWRVGYRRGCSRGRAAVLLLSLLLVVTTSPAAAQELLLPAGPEAAQGSEAEPRLGAARSRLVRLDLRMLERQMLPRGRDQDPQRMGEALARSGRISLTFFEEVTAELRRESIEPAVGGGYLWSGRHADGASGHALLVFGGDAMTGLVEREGRSFFIEPIGGGLHRVSEIDFGAFPPDDPPGAGTAIAPQGGPGLRPPAAPRAATTRIDVLIGVTPAARRASANIDNEANLAIAMANRTFANSAVKIRYRLVGVETLSGYNEQGLGLETVLRDVTSGSHAGAKRLRNRRDALRADLVAVLTQTANQNYCGIAWMPLTPSAGTKQWGYSVTWRSCIANHTFTHELGHNQGINHDRYVVPPAPPTAYNFGHVNLGARIRDVMAYNNACVARGFNCARVQYFSTPRIKVEGRHAIGVAVGKPRAAFAARRLNETRQAIAAYR